MNETYLIWVILLLHLHNKEQKMKNKTKYWRNHKYLSLLRDVALVILVMVVISWWVNRGSLAAAGQPAPTFTLTSLAGETTSLSDHQGKQVLLYFFAPWCSVCRLSADNLNDLRAARSEDDLAVMMVALSYENRAEVEAFVADLDLQVPVLLGTDQQFTDYQIVGFPTYYVIDEDGRVTHRSIGYSTEIGLRFRT